MEPTDQKDRDATPEGVAFRYQAQDFIDAYRLGAGMTRRGAAWLALGMAALAAFLFWSEPDWIARLVTIAAAVAGGGAAGVCYRFLYLPWLARRHFANYPLARLETTFAVADDALILTSDRTLSRLLWRDFVAWRANERTLLLYTAPRVSYVVPTRLAAQGFPLTRLLSILREKVAERR